MSWSKTSSIQPGQSQNKVRIKTKHGEIGLTNLEQQQVGQTVYRSRSILPQVIAWLSWPNGTTKAKLNPLLQRYFLTTGNWPAPGDIETILKKLELVMNGINAKINVKVAPDDGAYGYVGYKTGISGIARGIFSGRHNFGTRNGSIVTRGDIHIDQDTLDDAQLAVITFIHEATHKYASTADHGKSGYLENDGLTFEAPGLTPVQALNNADSYAWFCYAATA
jgi:hypothetical protein